MFQWQALEKEEFDSAISQWGTEGLNRDGTLKHSYPDDKWVLVPLGHWNWKWNQARGNYSTYEQELLAGMLVLSSQAPLLGSNPVVVMVFCFFVLSKSKSNSSTVFPLHASIGNHNPLRSAKRNFILCSVDTTMIIKFRIPTKHLLWPISTCTLI